MVMNFEHFVYDFLVNQGISEATAAYLNAIALTIALLIIAVIIDFIVKKIIIELFIRFTVRTKTNFDNLLVKNKVPNNVAHIIPLLVVIEFFTSSFC